MLGLNPDFLSQTVVQAFRQLVAEICFGLKPLWLVHQHQ
jgi:hypothetical protein